MKTITVSNEIISQKQKLNEKVYLSDLPEFKDLSILYNTVFNKSVTGIGGTSLALDSKENIIILMPFVEVVKNKENYNLNTFCVKESVTVQSIVKYLKTTKIRKIVATYDALFKIVEAYDRVGLNIYNDFLLIDEWQVIFQQFGFRYKVMRYLLDESVKFKNKCFMTATPISKEYWFDELQGLDELVLQYDLPKTKLIHFKCNDVVDEVSALVKTKNDNRNLHFFINSVQLINTIVKSNNLLPNEVRIVCSKQSKNELKLSGYTIESTTSLPKKYNFYTSTAFEGCLLPLEKVMTTDGLVNAKDVTLSHRLINSEGKQVSIINLQQYYKNNEKVFTIKLGNTYRTTTFTGKHPILISEHPKNKPFEFVNCSSIKKNNWVIYPNVFKKEIELDNYEWDKFKSDKFKSDSFKNINNPINSELFWWFIGLWLGDGWTQNDGYRVFISINNKDKKTIDRLQAFCNLIDRTYLIKEKNSNCKEYVINCKQLVDFLNSNFGKYSDGKYIPEKFKYINHNLKKSLINGYLDSDGCIMFTNNSYKATFVSINLELLEGFQDCLSSLGIKSSIKLLRDAGEMAIDGRIVHCNKTYDLNISHNELLKFYDLNENKDYQKLSKLNFTQELRNKRKPTFFNMEFSSDLNYIYFKINEIKVSNYTGIVYNYECDTHTYVCRHITTHNCDLYDTQAQIFVVADGNKAHSLCDITTTLPQIAGRIRDARDNTINLIYKTTRYIDVTQEEFERVVKNNLEEGERIAKGITYSGVTAIINDLKANDYYLRVTDEGVIFEKILLNLDRFQFNLSKTYSLKANIIMSTQTIFESEELDKEIAEKIQKYRMERIAKASFREKCIAYAEYPYLFGVVEKEVREAVRYLGIDKLNEMNFNKTNIKRALLQFTDKSKVNQILSALPKYRVGDFIPANELVFTFNNIYNLLNIDKLPKASDIANYFEVKKTTKRIDGKVVKGVVILNQKVKINE